MRSILSVFMLLAGVFSTAQDAVSNELNVFKNANKAYNIAFNNAECLKQENTVLKFILI